MPVESPKSSPDEYRPPLADIERHDGVWPTEFLWRWEVEEAHDIGRVTTHNDDDAIRATATEKLLNPLLPLFSQLKLWMLRVIYPKKGEDNFRQQKQDVQKARQIIEQIESVPDPDRPVHEEYMLERVKMFLVFVEVYETNRNRAIEEGREELTEEEVEQSKMDYRRKIRETCGSVDVDWELTPRKKWRGYFYLDI